MLYQQLLLQKPYKSNATSLSSCLQRRLGLWQDGDIIALLHECRTIQSQLDAAQRNTVHGSRSIAHQFALMVTNGKLHQAMQLLEDGPSGGVLELDEQFNNKSVREILEDKHPMAAPLHQEAVMSGPLPIPPHAMRFASLTRETVRRATLHTHGAAGPSGMDADAWRHMCTSFGDASDTLCDAIAKCAQRLATTYIDPASLDAYVASRLIPLNKHPGVRPIGIVEVLRRIISKSILSIIKHDIQDAAGSLQLCAGQECGIEAAIHAMRKVFESAESEGILLADATNAFNSVNREVFLRNVQHLCPALAPIAINCYRHPARLFVDGESLLFREGITQGDPIAMPLYVLATLPLLRAVKTEGAVQVWYADDVGAGGKIEGL